MPVRPLKRRHLKQTMNPKILDISNSVLVVVDVQEAFRSAIPDFALITSRIAMAVRGFTILDVPILVTEQYPKGLGHTAEEVSLSLPEGFGAIEKSTFSAYGEQAFVDRLAATNRKQVVLCGMETHICVSHTVQDLVSQAYDVHLLTDCLGSRFEHDRAAGISKMLAAGAVSSSTEMALFELMRDSKHPKFKDIQALVK